ncbi:MAG: hypothetical protein WBB45_13420 [Cyclobacteriaceae bacterium]
MQSKTIVIHSLTINGEYDASLPVACGQVMPDNNGNKGGQR